MKKMYIALLLSMGGIIQGMDRPIVLHRKRAPKKTVNILSMADFWSEFTPYLLYNWGPQVATRAIKASSCADKATFEVFKKTRLKELLIDLFQRYALSKHFKKEEVLGSLFAPLFTNAQQVKALYVNESVVIEAFVETLKSCAQSKDWRPASAQLEAIKKDRRLVLQLNSAYWEVNPLVRVTVLSCALLLNAPKELIKSLINCGAPVTNLSPKVLPPLLIMALKTKGPVTIDPLEILGEKVAAVIPNEVVDTTYAKELITLLCASGAQIEDAFCNSCTSDSFLKNLSALEWTIATHNNDLLEHLLLQQRETLLIPCALAAQTFVLDHMIPSRTDTQRLAGEECFKLLLENSKNNVSELFDACNNVIAGFQSIQSLEDDQAAELAESIMRLLSLFIEYGVDINHLMKKGTLLDQAQNEGWHEALIDFLIKKGARRSSYKFTQEEIKTQTFHKVLQDMAGKYLSGQPIEQEKVRDLLKDALERVKNGCMDLKDGSFHYVCILAVDLGTSLEETLEFLTCSESYNLFFCNSQSYGNISSVFHKIVAWLNDVKRACHKNVFNERIKRESLRSLLVKLAQRGVKDKPNNEGKTAAQKAYELGFEEIAHLITNTVSKD